MAETFTPRSLLIKSLKVIAFLGMLYALAIGAMLACAMTVEGYYDDIRIGEPVEAVLWRNSFLSFREVDLLQAVHEIPPAWLPERTGTVNGVTASAAVELYFISTDFRITVLIDPLHRVLVKYPSYLEE